jgi:hypothetical protein
MGAASRRAAEPYRIERYRAGMRQLVTHTTNACDDRVEIDRAGERQASPEDISLRGWRPERTYLICGTPGSGEEVLSEALASTGVAGLPRQLRVSTPTALLRHLEESATPNGVAGALISRPDFERLLVLNLDLPQLRVIRISRRHRGRPASDRAREERAWDVLLARQNVPQIEVSHEDLVSERRQATRAVIRQLGISLAGALDVHA